MNDPRIILLISLSFINGYPSLISEFKIIIVLGYGDFIIGGISTGVSFINGYPSLMPECKSQILIIFHHLYTAKNPIF
jgi:hypothetical protein